MVDFPFQKLRHDIPVVDPQTGLPTDYLLQMLYRLTQNAENTEDEALKGSTLLNTGTGLAGGGELGTPLTLTLDADLDDLNDVDTTTTPPDDGQALVWNDADNLWKPGDVAGGGGGGGSDYEAGPPTPPLLADFAWVRQGTSVASAGLNAFVFRPQADDTFRGFIRAAPTGNFSVYCRVDETWNTTDATANAQSYRGIAIRNSAQTRIVFFALAVINSSARFVSRRLDFTGDGTAIPSTGSARYLPYDPKWLRVTYDGTNLISSISVNGFDWFQIESVTVASFLTAAGGTLDGIGFGARSAALAAPTQFYSYFSTVAPEPTNIVPGSGAYMQVRDEKANGTNAGTNVAGWQTRALNTVKANTITGASLAANEITLPPGTYSVRAVAPAYYVSRHRLRLKNVTAGTTLLVGVVAAAVNDVSNSSETLAYLEGYISLTTPTVVRIEHYCQGATANVGLGVATSSGEVEVYTDVIIERVSPTGATVLSGAAFPTAPVTGQRFYRTDRNIEYFWDGVRWLSTQLHNMDIAIEGGNTFLGARTAGLPYPSKGISGVYLVSWDATMIRTEAGEWDLLLRWRNAANVNATLDTFDGAGAATLTWVDAHRPLGIVLDPTTKYLEVLASKISGAGTCGLIASATVNYRLIG